MMDEEELRGLPAEERIKMLKERQEVIRKEQAAYALASQVRVEEKELKKAVRRDKYHRLVGFLSGTRDRLGVAAKRLGETAEKVGSVASKGGGGVPGQGLDFGMRQSPVFDRPVVDVFERKRRREE